MYEESHTIVGRFREVVYQASMQLGLKDVHNNYMYEESYYSGSFQGGCVPGINAVGA